jgi:trans-aconitate methyltransferase
MDIHSPEILDAGCGAGDNTALLSTRFPGSRVDGGSSIAEGRVAKHCRFRAEMNR